MPPKPSSAKRRRWTRGRHAGNAHEYLIIVPGEFEFSLPVIGFTTLLLIIGFGPLLLAEMVMLAPHWEALLIASGPVLVCLGFALLTLYYGLRQAAASGWSRGGIIALAALFVLFGVLVGWGLMVSI